MKTQLAINTDLSDGKAPDWVELISPGPKV
jgi:hypothetical protein